MLPTKRHHSHVTICQRFNKFGSRPPVGVDLEDHNIGLHRGRVERQQLRSEDAVGENPCVTMILLKTIDLVFQRIECRSSQNSALPHGTAKQFSVESSLINQISRAAECRADWSPQPFAEADADRVKETAPARCLNSCRDNSIEQSCAIQVRGQPVLSGPLAKFLNCL